MNGVHDLNINGRFAISSVIPALDRIGASTRNYCRFANVTATRSQTPQDWLQSSGVRRPIGGLARRATKVAGPRLSVVECRLCDPQYFWPECLLPFYWYLPFPQWLITA